MQFVAIIIDNSPLSACTSCSLMHWLNVLYNGVNYTWMLTFKHWIALPGSPMCPRRPSAKGKCDCASMCPHLPILDVSCCRSGLLAKSLYAAFSSSKAKVFVSPFLLSALCVFVCCLIRIDSRHSHISAQVVLTAAANRWSVVVAHTSCPFTGLCRRFLSLLQTSSVHLCAHRRHHFTTTGTECILYLRLLNILYCILSLFILCALEDNTPTDANCAFCGWLYNVPAVLTFHLTGELSCRLLDN